MKNEFANSLQAIGDCLDRKDLEIALLKNQVAELEKRIEHFQHVARLDDASIADLQAQNVRSVERILALEFDLATKTNDFYIWHGAALRKDERIAELEKQLDRVTLELVRERGVPI